ncbi:ribonuclease catalytic domain-containing protein [Advenella mimigardefordensis]|uniref:Putative ribonuclease 2 n=1 Tax=Advenella mimigardefordensis (strain DSM 17166 / LMG 22922 / DPN7) TaxID=1247726 RepID=W0PGU0_ADVMD|nr:ribonuclease catalytic domain-containing protein [Advenella mimigardefordensis]AHG65012.1 putative ribonuclease 2 [Advenella mimigardefordensis DPN7]
MYVVFEDDGSFKAEKIHSEADSTLQVESVSGKRSKIKRNAVIFTFDGIEPQTMLEQARATSEDIDLQFLWECAPQDEFSAQDMALEYVGHEPSITEKTAILLRLHSAPAYFHRKGKGHYKAAPADILQAALAALEKKQRQAEQQQAWTNAMLAGTLPEDLRDAARTFLIRPDKNTLQWKAFEKALDESGKSAETLLLELGVYPHALALHLDRFLKQHFPKGTEVPELDIPAIPALPSSDVLAYSIDDISTTEIDDALSATHIDGDLYRIGVHIAAPALVVTRDSDLDKLARNRMSTLYMPGDKIPMQSDSLISMFSLDAGRPVPALSLYVTANIATGEIHETVTRAETVTIRENLRLDDLLDQVTREALEDPAAELPYAELFRPLWQLGQHLKTAREQVRGKPESNNRTEYTFRLHGPANDPESRIELIPRQRNAPLDQIVAEYMILANTQWGGYLNEHGLPGVYRSQQMGRTRMSTHPLPHESIGVPQYAWCTSPLRRYVDLVNQRQILAAAEHGVSARLVAPFKPKDADLYAIIGAFESQYTLWHEFQSRLERYWCLRWLTQQSRSSLHGTFIRDNLVRLEEIPLVIEVNGVPELERNDRMIINVRGTDELSLHIDAEYAGLAQADTEAAAT